MLFCLTKATLLRELNTLPCHHFMPSPSSISS